MELKKLSDYDKINIDIVKWPPNIFSVEMRQSLYCIYALSKLIMDTPNIKRIIEFGTGSGLMTALIGIYSHENNIPIYTYDIEPVPNKAVGVMLSALDNVHVSNDDIFTNEDSISKLISDDGNVIVLCDNGNKIKEFEMYSKYLKPGDVICAHDYFNKPEESNDGSETWVCCEICYKNIKEYCDMYNLKPYMDDVMKPSHWGCFIKWQ